MRITILINAYPPEIGGGAHQYYELAQALNTRGHNIIVITRFPRHLPKEIAPKNLGSIFIKEDRPEAKVIRVNLPEFSRRIPLMRELEHAIYFLFLLIASCFGKRPDVILAYSPPIVVGYAALLASWFKKSKVVLNVQDLFPQSLVDLGVLKNKCLIAISRFLEKYVYNKVDGITVMSEGNQEYVRKIIKEKGKTSVVYNWVDTDFIIPGPRENDFRREFGLGDKFILSFAGCIADSQDMDIILNNAKNLAHIRDIVFLIAGNGPNYNLTKDKVVSMRLDNVIVIPIQPREKYVKLLAASDVAMITLSPSVLTPVVPSKMLSIMSSARPILASLPLLGDAPKFIEKAKAGIVVEAGDTQAFCDAVLKLYNNKDLCEEYGRNGREHVILNYSLQVSARAYEELFERMIK